MAWRRFGTFLAGSFLLLTIVLPPHSQGELSAKEILEKNIQAAGGKDKLSQVKNFSFRFGTTTYYLSTDGIMKLKEGKEPIITEVIIADKEKVRRNCFNKTAELTGIQKSMYQSLARLWSGLFTLIHFKGQLEFQGLKSFGPEKHYLLTTKVGDLQLEFYLDSADILLKRVVFKGFEPSQGKYEVNHDFGPYQEIDGMKIPTSWFSSQIGARGSTYRVSDLKFNEPLDKGFFSRLDVNVGEVKIEEAALKGNIVESRFQRNRLLIDTNWTDDCVGRAGFKAQDKLILEIAEVEVEIDFYDSQPPRDLIGPGAKFMVPNLQNENYLIILGPEEYQKLSEKLEPLLPIRVRKK